jgi:hypothetical protein
LTERQRRPISSPRRIAVPERGEDDRLREEPPWTLWHGSFARSSYALASRAISVSGDLRAVSPERARLLLADPAYDVSRR